MIGVLECLGSLWTLWATGLAQHLDGLGAHFFEIDAQAFQDPGGNAFALAHQPQEQMFGANVVMVQTARFIDRQFDHLFGTRRQANLPQDNPIAPTDDKFDGAANFIQFHAEVAQNLRGNPFALTDEAQEQMLGADVVVVEALRFFLGETQDFPGSLSKFVKAVAVVHLCHPPYQRQREEPCPLIAQVDHSSMIHYQRVNAPFSRGEPLTMLEPFPFPSPRLL